MRTYDVLSHGADLRSEIHCPNVDSDIHKITYLAFSTAIKKGSLCSL